MDGVCCQLILDSGADITLFPSGKVEAERIGTKMVRWGDRVMELPLVEVEIKAGDLVVRNS